jgi:hypothetical protein
MIGYGSLTPKRDECTNLLVPVCLSSSHIAFGSIRMEPVFMILGQSAAVAAGMAIDGKCGVQEVDYLQLKQKLLDKGQVLEWTGPRPTARKRIAPNSLPGIVVDNAQAELTGDWRLSSTNSPFVGSGYAHDSNEGQGAKSAVFSAELPEDGSYSVRLAYPPNSNRASNIQVIVHHAGGTTEVTVNEREKPPIDDLFVELGEFPFKRSQPCAVEIRNEGANGYVVVDAVQWLEATE